MAQEALLQKSLGRGEFDHVLLSSVLRQMGYAAPSKKIHALMKAGVLTGIKKGLYVFSPDHAQGPVTREVLANLIYGPSYVSLEYALAHYGLIPERVEVISSVTPKRDKVFKTPVGTFTYRRLASEKYREGVELVSLKPGRTVFMASPEKALLDYIVLNKVKGLDNVSDARNFLEEDLRIDPTLWGRFNVITLHRLNRVYKSKSADAVIQVLEGLKS
jgi:hypothetical protein